MRGIALVTITAMTVTLGTAGAARATTCAQDGVATLCVSAMQTQDVLTINYQVTQADGPGAYSVSWTNTTTGATDPTPNSVGPLTYQQTSSGTMTTALNFCYNVTLTSPPGTSLTAGPVCG